MRDAGRPDARMVDATAPDVDTAPDATPDAPWDAGACRTIGAPDAGSFPSCAYDLPFYGDPASCGLDHFPGPQNVCNELCWNSAGDASGQWASCQLIEVDGSQMLECQVGCLGRRPPGLRNPERPKTGARSRVGEYLARAAYLEAASVDAFRILERELVSYGAPKRMLRSARRAARDEVRHARMTSALARRYGGAASTPARLERRGPRSLESMALENAVEGCVRETYGALLGMWQATAAQDPVVRAAMKRIARDETRHAELSWEVARWIERKLDRPARERVRAARRAAIERLAEEVASEPSVDLARPLGLPHAREAAELLSGLDRALWT
jgi:hypothetical protein